MSKTSSYTSKTADKSGYIAWSDKENAVWHDLITHQLEHIKGIACDEYINGLKLINLPTNNIPQLKDINSVLQETTGWKTYPVPALINFDKFFALLADKKFPVATFIRRREDFEYLQEPDIFHEIFGHCAMLTNPDFAEFTHIYGKIGLAADKKDRVWLARLYWFTVEFGLINTASGLRVYGGGILSSPNETQHAVKSDLSTRKPFDILEVLRTPYKINTIQPIYFTINNIRDLYDIAQLDIMKLVKQAKELGLYEPTPPPKIKN